MFRILFRLYLVTIVSFSAAIYLVPDLVIKVFRSALSATTSIIPEGCKR
jgi:hypothetical protein